MSYTVAVTDVERGALTRNKSRQVGVNLTPGPPPTVRIPVRVNANTPAARVKGDTSIRAKSDISQSGYSSPGKNKPGKFARAGIVLITRRIYATRVYTEGEEEALDCVESVTRREICDTRDDRGTIDPERTRDVGSIGGFSNFRIFHGATEREGTKERIYDG